jgi:hypothetical protein
MSTSDDPNFESDFRTAAEANTRKAGELEAKLLEKIEGRLDSMDGKEAASALQAVANMKARNVEKLRAGERAPDKVDDPAELLGSMVRKGYLKLSGPAAALGLEANDDDQAAGE